MLDDRKYTWVFDAQKFKKIKLQLKSIMKSGKSKAIFAQTKKLRLLGALSALTFQTLFG